MTLAKWNIFVFLLADVPLNTGRIFPIDCNGHCQTPHEAWAVFKDQENRIWTGTDIGLFQWIEKEDNFKKIDLKGTPRQQAVRHIIQDEKGNLWMSTLHDNGLFRWYPATGHLAHFKHDPSNGFGLSSNHVRNLMIGELGHLWIGAYNGLNKLNLNPPRFALLQQEPGNERTENLIFTSYVDDWGGLWFSTYEQQLFYAKEPGQKATQINAPPFDGSPIEVDKFCSTTEGEVWIATWPNQVVRYEVESGNLQPMPQLLRGKGQTLTPYHFMEEDVDDPAFVWFSSQKGLCRYYKQKAEYTFYPPSPNIPVLKSNLIVNGLQTSNGKIYVLFESHFNGRLGCFDKTTGTYRLIETSGAFSDGKSTIHIRQFSQTSNGIVWMATADGMGKYDPQKDTFQLFTLADGLAESNLMGIATDHLGNVWLKSLHYLSKYSPITHSFWHFNASKDMKEFNTVGATAGQDGRLFFHGNNGFYAFYPDSVRLDTTLPKAVLTDFKILNKSQHFGTSPELKSNHPSLPN